MRLRRTLVTAFTAVAAVLGAALVAVSPAADAAAGLHGYDISWPQCPSTTPPDGDFVIIGLTDGKAFTTNPCLAAQRTWSLSHTTNPAHAYTWANYPTSAQLTRYGASGPWTSGTTSGQLHNVGYAEGTYAASTLAALPWKPPAVWVDVEQPAPTSTHGQLWPDSPTRALKDRNRFVIEGVLRALEDNGYAVGIYSVSSHWAQIVGSWWLPGIPAWVSAGTRGETAATAMCSQPSWSGGTVVLAQWWDATTDYDVTCAPWTFTPPKPPAPSTGNDVNGDWKDDLLAREASTGKLWLYPGNGAKSGNVFAPRVVSGLYGWNTFRIIETVGDFTGDGRMDLVGVDSGGTLWLYPGNGGTWGTRRVIGNGWQGMSAIAGVGDFTGDGKPDLVALQPSNGTLWLYPGNGNGSFLARRALKTGLAGMDRVVGVGDMTLNGVPDIIMRADSSGSLYLYPGYVDGTLGPRVTIGSGWNAMVLFAGAGDWTADGVPDLIVREKASTGGELWLYKGLLTGKLGVRRQIGSGWQIMNALA